MVIKWKIHVDSSYMEKVESDTSSYLLNVYTVDKIVLPIKHAYQDTCNTLLLFSCFRFVTVYAA